MGNIKIHSYGTGLILGSYALAQRRLNDITDGFGSRTAFIYSAYLSAKILVSSTDKRGAAEPVRK